MLEVRWLVCGKSENDNPIQTHSFLHCMWQLKWIRGENRKHEGSVTESEQKRGQNFSYAGKKQKRVLSGDKNTTRSRNNKQGTYQLMWNVNTLYPLIWYIEIFIKMLLKPGSNYDSISPKTFSIMTIVVPTPRIFIKIKLYAYKTFSR